MTTYCFKIMRHMSVNAKVAQNQVLKGYEEAVRTLNTLQSNASILEQVRKEQDRFCHLNIPETIEFARRAGITGEDLDKLNIIHLAGTKGKGSTCAFSESILRNQGYKTGFFSSPHLVEVRERIRINGRPISKAAFNNYFWQCYGKLEDTKDQHDGKMPAYFRFLTIMAFHVFKHENVDVAIIEVGIGGAYDSTNIIRNSVVCGVSSLGLDHVRLLGDTVEKIAWNKAGIFKPGVPAITVPQPGKSLQILKERAQEIGCPLHIAPPLQDYNWGGRPIKLGIAGDVHLENATLALQLCKIWVENHRKSIAERNEKVIFDDSEKDFVPTSKAFSITSEIAAALTNTVWPGRTQIVHQPGVSYYIDGAHTKRSIEHCVRWFKAAAEEDGKLLSRKVVRVLLFNTTGDREMETLLEPLVSCSFDGAIFCPNIIEQTTGHADQSNFTVSIDNQLRRCVRARNVWLEMTHKQGSDITNCKRQKLDPGCIEEPLDTSNTLDPVPSFTFPTIADSIKWLSHEDSGRPASLRGPVHIQVLVTGSLHLVGGVLALLQPDLNEED